MSILEFPKNEDAKNPFSDAERDSAIAIKDRLVAHGKKFGVKSIYAIFEVFTDLFLKKGSKYEIK